jgi:hypothetical protein
MAEGNSNKTKAAREFSQEEYNILWQNSVGALIEPATAILEATSDSLEHAGLQLEIIPRRGTQKYFNWLPGAKRTEQTDIEAEGTIIKPGDPEFSRILEDKLTGFSNRRIEALTACTEGRGLSAVQMEKLETLGERGVGKDPSDGHVPRDRQQLYLILYIQHMVSKNR